MGNKSIILSSALIIIALILFFWPEKQPEITRLNEIESADATIAVSAVKNIYEVSSSQNDMQLKKVMLPMIDETGFRECQSILKDIKSPFFDRAKVLSPNFNKEIYYVSVPESQNRVYQFTMRKIDGKLFMESICCKNN